MKMLDKLSIKGDESNNFNLNKFLLILLLSISGISIFGSIYYLFFNNEALCYCLASITTIICFVLIIGKKEFTNILKKLLNIKTWIIGLLLGSFLVLINIGLTQLIELLTDNISANENGVRELILNNKILGCTYVILFAPFIEEFAYRYGLFGYLKKYKRFIAYIVSGIVFGLIHFANSTSEINWLTEILSLGVYSICGLTLCFIYDYTNSLTASIIAHMLNNIVAVIILFI